jgi:hypothetical protein
MVAESGTPTAGLDSNHSDLFVLDEVIEESDGICFLPDARHEHVGQSSFSKICARASRPITD